MSRARGAALLLVLWLVTLLAALVGAFALTARTEHLQGLVLARGLEARAAARAGIEYAVVRAGSSDPRSRWAADGSEHPWQFGADDRTAAGVAGAILDWRDADPLTQPAGGAEDPEYRAAGRGYGPANEPLRSVAEVEQVLGVTPQLYARMAPFVTVYSGLAVPETAHAPPPVRAAMGMSGPPPPVVAGNSGTYSIESRASIRGRTAVLRVVVRSGGNGLPGSAWTPLRWEEGASPR